MNIRRRLERLEGGASGRHSLGWINAEKGEALLDAVTRVAQVRGLELHQIGHAMAWWPDGTFETYRTVDDPSKLIGWINYEQRLEYLDKHENQ